MIKKILSRIGILPGHLPNLIIPGVQKAATTSLYHYLTQHPEITGGATKEIHFFDIDHKFALGTGWYKKQFLRRSRYILDATPSYLYEEHIPVRIRDTLGMEVKFIVLLRDPVSRCFSAWNMYRQLNETPQRLLRFAEVERKEPRYQLYSQYYTGEKFPSFSEAIHYEIDAIASGTDNFVEPGILRRGFYRDQIKHWLTLFPKENFLFLEQNSLRGDNLLPTLDCISSFLEVSPDWSGISTTPKHKRAYSGKTMDEQTEQLLNSIYRERNKGLQHLTGLQLDWPCFTEA